MMPFSKMDPKHSKDCSCGDLGGGRLGGELQCLACQEHRQFVILGMNEVPMARHGLILKDNEAMGSGKVFKYLPGLRDIICISKIAADVRKTHKLLYFYIGGRRRGRSPYYPAHHCMMHAVLNTAPEPSRVGI